MIDPAEELTTLDLLKCAGCGFVTLADDDAPIRCPDCARDRWLFKRQAILQECGE